MQRLFVVGRKARKTVLSAYIAGVQITWILLTLERSNGIRLQEENELLSWFFCTTAQILTVGDGKGRITDYIRKKWPIKP
jgi:hypothetical protein